MLLKNNPVKVLCVGILVLTVWLTILTHARKLARHGLDMAGNLTDDNPYSLSGIPLAVDLSEMADGLETMENVVQRPLVWGSLNANIAAYHYGLIELDVLLGAHSYSIDNMPNIPNPSLGPNGRPERKTLREILQFNHRLGLYTLDRVIMANPENQEKNRCLRAVRRYFGPKGFSDQPGTSQTGRFGTVITGITYKRTGSSPHKKMGFLLLTFDRESRRFYRIDPLAETIAAGPPQQEDYVAINNLTLDNGIAVHFSGVTLKVNNPSDTPAANADNVPDNGGGMSMTDDIMGNLASAETVNPDSEIDYKDFGMSDRQIKYDPNGHILLLEADGTIRRLNLTTLSAEEYLGTLTNPNAGMSGRGVRENLMLYHATSFVDHGRHVGTACLSLDRTGSRMELSVFDARGELIPGGAKSLNLWSGAGRSAEGVLSAIVCGATEMLYPPAIIAASAAAAGREDPIAERKHIFLMPDALLIATAWLKAGEDPGEYIGLVSVVYSPGLIFSLLAGIGVFRHGIRHGLPKPVRVRWFFACLLLGIPAVIVYGLTRLREVRVTCRFCGKLRAPGAERCCYCGHGWEAAQLEPPAWRINNDTISRELNHVA